MTYKSTKAEKNAKDYGTKLVQVLSDIGIPVICQKDLIGQYGIYFVFPGMNIHVLSIQDHPSSPRLSLQYKTVYRFLSGNRPICYGLEVKRSLPSVSTTVKNLRGRYSIISDAYSIQVQEYEKEQAFRSEVSALEKEFPRFKINIEGEVNTGHSIQFDRLPLQRARQILQVLTKYLPEK